MGMLRSWIAVLGLAVFAAGCVQSDQSALNYGTVMQVRPADAPGENTGLGALAGAGVGGVIGSQFGRSGGNVAATVVGVLAGAVAGAATEGALQDASGLEYTVRLADGRVLTVVQHREAGDRVIQPGERVVVQANGRYVRVLPAAGGPASAH